MKKIIAIIIIAALVAAFAACKTSTPETVPTEEPTAQPTEAPTDEPTEAPTEAPTDAPVDAVAQKVADYVELVKPQMQQAAAAMADTMSIDCYAEDRDFVIEYRYLSDVEVNADELAATIDASGESFKAMYDQLADYAGTDEVRVVLRYLKNDGAKVLDYVVDKVYVPGGSGYEYHYDSLEELVGSDTFLSSIQSNDIPGTLESSAVVENGNTIVLVQKYLQELSEEERAAFKSAWDESIAQTGDYAAKTLVDSFKLLVDVDEIGFVYRIVDSEGELISEYTANLQ